MTIKLNIIHKKNKRPISGLRVSAWDKDVEVSDHLGTAISGPDGRFTITFDESRFRDGLSEGSTPEVFFIIYRGDEVIHTTEGRPLTDEKAWENAVIELDIPMEALRFGVSGRLISKKGKVALPGLKVEVWDKDVKINDFLGVAFSDAEGNFSLTFSEDKYLDHPHDALPDMFFRVFQKETLVLSTEGKAIKNTAWVEGLVLELKLEPEQVNPPQPPVFQKKDDLLVLADLKNRTPEEILKIQPEFYHQLQAQALQALGNTLQEHFKTASPELQYYIGAIDYAPLVKAQQPVTTFIETTLKSSTVSVFAQSEGQSLLAKWNGPTTFQEILNPSVSLKDNIHFNNEFRQADVWRVADYAQLPATKANALLAKGFDLSSLSQEILDSYVQEGTIQAAEAQRLGFQGNLFQFAAGHLPLVSALRDASTSNKIDNLSGFATWKRKEWQEVLEANKVTPPGDQSVTDYSDELYKQMERLFPVESFIAQSTLPALGTLPLETLANRYPGLQLQAIIADDKVSDGEKEKEIVYRSSRLATFYRQNQKVPMLDLNLGIDHPDLQSLDMSGFEEPEQAMFLDNLRAVQRVYSTTSDLEYTFTLLEKGYHSATQMAFDGLGSFAAKSGLPAAKVDEVYKRAQNGAMQTMIALGGTIDYAKGRNGLPLMPMVDTASERVGAYLKRLNGFSDFFGNQNFCNCKHCQSIVSPAAYFIDLMEYVNEHITTPIVKEPHLANHLSLLHNRRSDLWRLPLTCKNTNTLIPYLVIINEVLEDYIALQLPGLVDGSRGRYGVESYVYNAVYSRLPLKSFAQPFCLPLLELTTYLKYFNLDRSTIAETVFASTVGNQAVLARAYFNLSIEEANLIASAHSDAGFLTALYGFPVPASEPFTITDVQVLLHPMRISRKEFSTLSKTKFVTSGVGIINIRPGISPGNVQPDREIIEDLFPAHLDRMHRFQRLTNHVDWSVEELDTLLEQMYAAGLETVGNISLPFLHRLSRLQKQMKVSVADLCALFFDILPEHFGQLFNSPRLSIAERWGSTTNVPFQHPGYRPTPRTEEDTKMLNRLRAGLGVDDEQLFQLIERLGHVLGLNTTTKSFNLNVRNLSVLYRHALLLKYLKIQVADLFRAISAANMGSRHIQNLEEIEKLLDLLNWQKNSGYSLAELTSQYEKPDFSLLAKEIVAQIHETQALFFADTLFSIIEGITEAQSKAIIGANSERIQQADLRTYRLSQERELPALVVPSEVALSAEQLSLLQTRIIDHYKSPGAITLTDQFIANVLSISLSSVRALLQANPLIFIQVERPMYHLYSVFNETEPLIIPEKIPLTSAQALVQLRPFIVGNVVAKIVGERFNCSTDRVRAFFKMANADLDSAAIGINLRGYIQDISFGFGFPQVLGRVHGMTIFYKDTAYTSEVLAFISSHVGPDSNMLEIPRLHSLGATDIRKLDLLKIFVKKAGKHFSSLVEVLEAFGLHGTRWQFGVGDAQAANLALIFDVDKSLVNALNQTIVFTSEMDAVTGLEKMRRCIKLSQLLGISGEILPRLAAEGFEEMRSAAEIIKTAIRLKFETDKDYQNSIGTYEDRIRENKRDALTDFITRSLMPNQFKNNNDLFNYFLIDTELEGCARISRVVAAISSLQLYVQRCLLNLEQSQDGLVHVKMNKPAAQEWEWRKNYRVWEANRKVFLYPENYLEPDLRDDKTPLFKELEQILLQQEINAQTVTDAYTQYLKGFEEIAQLQIAGAYHDLKKTEEEGKDILHLFATTASEPPIYYYRTIENVHSDGKGVVYHPWEKLTLQIPVRKVSPIVYLNRLFVFWVEITTRPLNEVIEGTSYFTGYKHKVNIKFTSLKQDNSWAAPQTLKLIAFPDGDGIIKDRLLSQSEIDQFDTWLRWKSIPQRSVKKYLLSLKKEIDPIPISGRIDIDNSLSFEDRIADLFRSTFIPEYETLPNPRNRSLLRMHFEPLDDYALEGYQWIRIYPDSDQDINIYYHSKNMKVDLLSLSTKSFSNWNSLQGSPPSPEGKRIINKTSSLVFNYPLIRFMPYYNYFFAAQTLNRTIQAYNISLEKSILNLPPDLNFEHLELINGSLTDILFGVNNDMLYVHSYEKNSKPYSIKRLGTTLSEKLSRKLFTEGVDGLLGIDFQTLELQEGELPVSLNADVVDDATIHNVGRMDTTGSLGVYYREMFMHIPFLIANHLNSQGKYADAQRWYHYIFDPTSDNIPPKTGHENEEKRKNREARRVWQFIEFRNHKLETIIERLNDRSAVEAYQSDPFNPHAIARLRLSAYMKSAVMKYIDNLLDWGDQLFAQDTVESINEATLLYVMAQEILGARPIEIGDCDDEKKPQLTYARFTSALTTAQKKLVYLHALETEGYKQQGKFTSQQTPTVNYDAIFRAKERANPGQYSRIQRTNSTIALASATAMLKQALLFCIPNNPDLLAYWDRVEDRLYKIRNCMNISGVRRQLALFAPEIDPRLLVRAKAAGISLSDILDSMSGNLPPYRFSFLLAKAKEYAGTVQGLGAAMLSSIEKREGEELNNLRMAQQDAILKMSTQMRNWEIEAAEIGLESLNRRVAMVTARKEYYDGLISGGLNDWEEVQIVSKGLAYGFTMAALPFSFLSAGMAAAPSVLGFSFSTPTKGVSKSMWTVSSIMRMMAELSGWVSESAGLAANFTRREEGWQFSLDQTNAELKELEKQLEAAQIRLEISRNSLVLHEKSIEHLKETFDFYRDKFSNLGLYTWLSSTMQRLYREAYNNALDIARLAERAYRFERNDDNSVLLNNNYWEASRAGLLAGELLMSDLRRMEIRYMETHDRHMEIDQAFSITQIAPGALLKLKTEGSCEFTIPELYFDLFYPGQYRRRIKSARLTIPCITGPYTNVSAVLTLTGSKIRKDAKLGDGNLFDVPPSRTTTVAASTAQNDSGVFRLDFRDERYMPFEGAGSVESTWRLELPKTFKTFDYTTINDVIIHISYTAAYDGGRFRQDVENQSSSIIGSLINYLGSQAVPRLFSLRQEFSQSFHRLMQQPVGTTVPLELGERHFPLFLQGQTLRIVSARLVLEVDGRYWPINTEENPEPYDLQVEVNGVSFSAVEFVIDPNFGMPSLDISSVFNTNFAPATSPLSLNLRVTGAGHFATESNPSSIDDHKLKDVYVYFEYRLWSAPQ